jgi:nucleotide-binding universal stress UspA family protein
MGSNGSEGLHEVFIGSNTEKVVRFSHVPVLVIKEDIPIFDIKSFVFATNLTLNNRNAFEKALVFSNLLDVELHLVYINTPHKFKTTKEIDQSFDEFSSPLNFNSSKFQVYNDVTVERGIRNLAIKLDADPIGIGTHGRKGISHFISGSLAENIVNHIKNPIVTFKI